MSTNEVMAFVQKIGPLIVAEGQKRGYKVYSTVIAQAIIESRYGLTQVSAYFRKYPDMQSGVIGYYDFISSKRYANLKDAVTYEQYAQYLKADGYATSSTYVQTLCKTVAAYGLIAFDQGLSPVPMPEWIIGWEYTTQQDLNVRSEPNGPLLAMEDLTRVTVRDIASTGTCTWIRIPSGWICAQNSKNTFVI